MGRTRLQSPFTTGPCAAAARAQASAHLGGALLLAAACSSSGGAPPADAASPEEHDGSVEVGEPHADSGEAGAPRDARPVDARTPHDGTLEAASDGARLLVDHPLDPLPDSFSGVGFFEEMNPAAPLSRAIAYTPRWPLWSNGSEKVRWLLLPDAEAVDNVTADGDSGSDRVWEFPVGTLIVKSFSYAGAGAPLETRLMRFNAEGDWDFAAYIWDASRSDATRGDRFSSTTLPVEEDAAEFEHTVPSELECRTCHEAAEQRVLGFNALQLDVNGQLERLERAGVFARPVGAPPLLGAATLEETAILGYFVGNCVHCHNAWAGSPDPAFSLAPAVAFQNVIGQETQASGSATGIRVVPGDASASILFRAVSGETDDLEVRSMPPLGVDRRDLVFVEQLRSWIRNLETE